MQSSSCSEPCHTDGLGYPAIQCEFVEKYSGLVCGDAKGANIDLISSLKPDLLTLAEALVAAKLLIGLGKILANIFLQAGRFLIGQADHRLSCFIEDILDIDDIEPANHCAAEDQGVYVCAIKLFADLQDSVGCIVSANCGACECEAVNAEICSHDYARQTRDRQIPDETLCDAEDSKGGLVEMERHK